jgi:hypothetical protein
MKNASENPKKVAELAELAKGIKGDGFPQRVLRQSISDLIYVLKRIDKLIQLPLGDYSSYDEKKALKLFRSTRLVQFYSQCLLLWGFRLLEILKETSGLEIPSDIRVARDVLVAHFGIARGNLTKRLNAKEIVVDNPKISPNGNLTYALGSLGGPASFATSTERQEIEQLYKKYCLDESKPNVWEVCHKILCQNNQKVEKADMDKIEKFLRNNGGIFTTSHRILDFVIASLKQYTTLNA